MFTATINHLIDCKFLHETRSVIVFTPTAIQYSAMCLQYTQCDIVFPPAPLLSMLPYISRVTLVL